jgi:bromodomain adjacent to zinc finger domain protein 1A
LSDEEDAVRHRMRLLEHEFRSNLYTLRARPLGSDRYCNKVWWMDGLGSAPLVGSDGKVCYGTGRLYLQGAEDLDLEFARLAAVAANDGEEVPSEAVNERRDKEEREGKLAPGEWASYDTPEQVSAATLPAMAVD